MLRVLWITPYAPAFTGGGGRIRQAHLLAALAADHSITIVTAGVATDERVRSLATDVVEVPVQPRDRAALGPLRRRSGDLLAAVVARRSQEVADEVPVARALRAAADPHVGAADVVVLEYAGLGALAAGLSAPTVLTLHNLPSRMAQHLAEVTRGRRRWFHRRDAAAGLRHERAIAERADRVVVVSAEDAVELARPCTVIPNGVDLEEFPWRPLAGGAGLVFTGALSTGPNRDGARWLAEEVLPIVRAARPDAHLEIVGAGPPAEVRALGSLDGVTVVADVPSVRPHLERAAVAAVALRVGSGTRLKALEALAVGRPVVGTAIGLEGLGLRVGEHALVADDAPAFAAAVLALLEDPGRAEALAVAGRALVEERFGWASIGSAFAALVEAAAAEGPGHSSGSGP